MWISLTLVYGFRVWRRWPTALILGAVVVTTGASISSDAFDGSQLWGELFEVPLMAAMFLAMVWHAQRRASAVNEAEALVALQERFLHDVSHELRTPVTIARGHLELLGLHGEDSPELSVALDELGRIERIITRLLLLAKAGEPRFLAVSQVDVEGFVEDVFVRWAEVAPRRWILGTVSHGHIEADEEALRAALDALLENAVKYTEEHETIELRALGLGGDLVIEVVDGGCGIPPEALDRIFDRFARADDARTRTSGGVGLGLSIVERGRECAWRHLRRAAERARVGVRAADSRLPAVAEAAAVANRRPTGGAGLSRAGELTLALVCRQLRERKRPGGNPRVAPIPP